MQEEQQAVLNSLKIALAERLQEIQDEILELLEEKLQEAIEEVQDMIEEGEIDDSTGSEISDLIAEQRRIERELGL